MNKFVDEVIIEVASGKGGDGAVSFRREKYVPKGGPDGGDGGKGGDVIFVVKKNLKTLSHLKQKYRFYAKNGKAGGSKRKSGKRGEDIFIPIPPGTIIKDFTTQKIIKDFSSDTLPLTLLTGGSGGKGNSNFATPTNRTPRFAKPGKEGKLKKLICELNIIADAGLIGLPNVGKSTLLSVLTNAHPKIASYPFTTKVPHLGVMYHKDKEMIIADIPGIIEGASHGSGLGLRFLKHITRTKMLIFLIDSSSPTCVTDFAIVKKEMESYAKELLSRNRLIVFTKADLADDLLPFKDFKDNFKEETVIRISSINRQGLEELKDLMITMLADA